MTESQGAAIVLNDGTCTQLEVENEDMPVLNLALAKLAADLPDSEIQATAKRLMHEVANEPANS